MKHSTSQGEMMVFDSPSGPIKPSSTASSIKKSNSNASLRSEHSLRSGSRKSSLSMDPEELIRSAVENILRPCTESPQKSSTDVDEKVSRIYDIVGRALAETLKNVTVQQNASAAKLSGLRIQSPVLIPPVVADEPSREENLTVSCNSSPSVSPTPASSIYIDRQDSVETNESAPHSASSQRTIQSSDSERSGSVKTDVSGPHSASSQHRIQSSGSERSDSVNLDVFRLHSASSQHGTTHNQSSGNERSDSIKTNESGPHSASSQHTIQSLYSRNGDVDETLSSTSIPEVRSTLWGFYISYIMEQNLSVLSKFLLAI